MISPSQICGCRFIVYFYWSGASNYKYETFTIAIDSDNLPDSLTCTTLSRIDGIASINVSGSCGISWISYSGKTLRLGWYNVYGWEGQTLTIKVFQNGD